MDRRESARQDKRPVPARMIDRDQSKLVDEVDLFHRLAKADTEITIAGFELRAIDLDPLVGIGGILRCRRNPVANDPAPITSEMNSYLLPFQANSVGQELPRRSSSVKVTACWRRSRFRPAEPRSARAFGRCRRDRRYRDRQEFQLALGSSIRRRPALPTFAIACPRTLRPWSPIPVLLSATP